MIFTLTLLAASVFMNNGIELFMEFYKNLVYLVIYPGLTLLEYHSGKLRRDEIFVRRVHNIVVCYGPVPFIDNEFSIRINKYPLISTCFGEVNSSNRYIITAVIVVDVLHPYFINIDKDNSLDLPKMP